MGQIMLIVISAVLGIGNILIYNGAKKWFQRLEKLGVPAPNGFFVILWIWTSFTLPLIVAATLIVYPLR